MTDEQARWLGQLLNKRGTFVWHKHNSTTQGPRIQVRSADLPTMTKVAALFHTKLYHESPSKTARRQSPYMARVSRGRAAHIMRQIRPHVGTERGQKIDELLERYERSVIGGTHA